MEEAVDSPRDLARLIADALDDKKGNDIALLDVGDLLQITEVFVIATGTSRPHVQTLAEAVEERLREAGRKPLRSEGKAEGEWVLIDWSACGATPATSSGSPPRRRRPDLTPPARWYTSAPSGL